MGLALDPSPAPTVTETVAVPTSFPTPVITIVPPDEGIDVWKDMIFGDFVGAVLGVAASIGVAIWLVRKERQAREKAEREAESLRRSEQRVRDADGLIASLRAVNRAARHGDVQGVYAAVDVLADQVASVSSSFPADDPHEVFRGWLFTRLHQLLDHQPPPLAIPHQNAAYRAQVGEMLAAVHSWRDAPDLLINEAAAKSLRFHAPGQPDDHRRWRRESERLRWRADAEGAAARRSPGVLSRPPAVLSPDPPASPTP